MKKSSKTNRSNRKTNQVNQKKLFRGSAQGIEALEPRQLLAAMSPFANGVTEVPLTNNTAYMTFTPDFSGDTNDSLTGEKAYIGFRVYGQDSSGNWTDVSDFALDIKDAEGNTVQALNANSDWGNYYSYTTAELVLNSDYSLTVTAPTGSDITNINVVGYLIGDSTNFQDMDYNSPNSSLNGMALSTLASKGSGIETVEVQRMYAAFQNSGLATNAVNNTQTGDWDLKNDLIEHFSMDSDGSQFIGAEDIARVEANQALSTNGANGFLNLNLSYDQDAPEWAVLNVYEYDTTAATSGTAASLTSGQYNFNFDNVLIDGMVADKISDIASVTFQLSYTAGETTYTGTAIAVADGSNGIKLYTPADTNTTFSGYNARTEITIDVLAFLKSATLTATDGTTTLDTTAMTALPNGTFTFAIVTKDTIDNVSKPGANYTVTLNRNAVDAVEGLAVSENGFTVKGSTNNVTNLDNSNSTDKALVFNVKGTNTSGNEAQARVFAKTTDGNDVEIGRFSLGTDASFDKDLKLNSADNLIGAFTDDLGDGLYNFRVDITDTFGNVGDSLEYAVTIDTAAPEFTFTLDGATGTSFSLLDDVQSDVVVTLGTADATAVTVKLTEGETEIGTTNLAAGTTVAEAMTITNAYGKRDFTLTATDAAGNVVTKSFTIYSNNAPTADAITVNVNEAQTTAYTAANGVQLDFAAAVADAITDDSTLTVSVNAPANGKLCVVNEDGSLSALVPADGKISFTADKEIYYVPNQYWFGSESLTYTVTDNFKTVYTDQTNATSAEATISITVNAVDSSLISPIYTNPTAVEEDSAAADQTVATFSFPTNEARVWTASAAWSNAVVNQLNAGEGTDATSLFTTAPTFTVVADGEPSNGIQNYKVVMSGWTLGANLWGSEDFTLTIAGAKAAETAAIADLSVTATSAQTFTVSSVNDAPAVDKGSIYNVSLSTLAKGDVTLEITDDMYSDIDDADANLTISKITIGETEIAQGSSAKIYINNVEVTFTFNGKSIVIAQNDGKSVVIGQSGDTIIFAPSDSNALDKGTISFAITVEDNAGAAATSSETQLSTVKFSAYASDDTVNIKEDAAQTGFNVLKNDKESSENWDGKTFTISQVNGFAAVAVNDEITLTVDGKTAGVLKVLDLATAAEGENNFAFTPATDWNGTATFEYTIVNSADSTETATATVTINVAAVNDYPTTFTWNSDYADVDPTDSSKATTTFDEDKSENEGENQPFNFSIGTYTDIDTALADLESIVKGNATLVQAGRISADQATDDGNLFTDWSLAVVAVDGVANQYDLQMTVTLKENAWGTATLTFTPTDEATEGSQGTAPVEHTLTINVTPVNDAPVTGDTDITIDEDADYTEIVLSSVSDVESPKENLFLQVTAPTNGNLYTRAGEGTEESPYAYTEMTYTEGVSAWITGAQKVFYKSNANYVGTDTFQYQIKDTLSDSGVTEGDAAVSNIATFTVNITAVNDAPVFTPNATDFTKAAEGENAGKYVINTNLNEDAASTTINLGKVSDVDTALESITISTQTVTSAGTKTSAAATADMSLFDGTPSFAINTDGDLIMTYKLAADVSGYADITIQVNDGQTENNLSETFQFKLVVDPVNDAPVATDAAWGVSIGALEKATTGITYDLAQNASDVDGDSLSYSATIGETALTETAQDITVGEGENAVVVSASISGSFVTLAYVSGDIDKLDKQELALAFTVSDGTLTANGTGTIKFSAYTQDDEAQYTQIAEAATNTIDVLANDTANWGDKVFTITAVTALSDPNAGTISIVNGKIDYVQTAGYRGTFTFTYTISEVDDAGALVTGGETAEGTVTVLVKALNTAPTAAQVDASIDESQTGTDKIQLAFSAAVADAETADDNLTITIAESAVTNGTLVDSDGTAFTAADGKYTFAATTAVYFKPNQYYNGSVTIPYTVTDRVDVADFAGLTLADGETVETATSNAVVVVSAVTSAPIIAWDDAFTGLTCKEDKADFEQTFPITVGTIKLPSNEAASLGLAAAFSGTVSGAEHLLTTINGIFTLSDAVKETTDGIEYNVWTISMNDFTLTDNAWCADGKFTLTLSRTVDEIKSDLTPTKEIAFTVTPINDAPTVSAAVGSGAVEDTITVTFAATDVETAAASLTYTIVTLPSTGSLYKDGSETAMAVGDTFTTANVITYKAADGTTVKSDTFTYTVTDSGVDAGLAATDSITTAAQTATISFNAAPTLNLARTETLNQYYKSENTLTATALSWTLFNTSNINDETPATVTVSDAVFSSNAASLLTAGYSVTKSGSDYVFNYTPVAGAMGVVTVKFTLTDEQGAASDVYFTLNLSSDINVSTEQDTTIGNSKNWEFAGPVTLQQLFGLSDEFVAANPDYASWFTVDYENVSVTTGEKLEGETADAAPITKENATPVTVDVSTGTMTMVLKDYTASQDLENITVVVKLDSTKLAEMPEQFKAQYADAQLKFDVNYDQFVTAKIKYELLPDENNADYGNMSVIEFSLYDMWNDYKNGSIPAAGRMGWVCGLGITVTFPGKIRSTEYEGETYYDLITPDTLVFAPDPSITTDANGNEVSQISMVWFSDAKSLDSGTWSSLGTLKYIMDEATLTGATVKVDIQPGSFRKESSGNYVTLNGTQVMTGSDVSIYGTESAEQTVVEGTGVYMQLSTDAPVAQTAETLPQSETWINEWQDHYVNLYANTQDATIIDGRLSFALNYDPAYFTATDFVAGDALLGGKATIVDGTVYVTGLADSLDASNEFILLGSVKFESLEDNGVAADSIGGVDMGLALNNIFLFDADGNQIAVNTQTVVETKVWAVVYDANDSGAIDMTDFVSFAKYFNTNTIVSNDAMAWALDFDKSGTVNMTDFISFAKNFGSSRSNGRTINFAEGFVKEYIGVQLEGEGDANLTELLDKAVEEWETKLDTDLDVNIQLKVKDYSDAQLGESYIVSLTDDGRPLTGVITIDSNAAGLYWSINTDEVAEGKYDLYTIILHEVGHLLGYTDQYSAFNEVKDDYNVSGTHSTNSSDLMFETVDPGQRKDISDQNAAVIKDAYAYAAANGATLTYTGAAATATVTSIAPTTTIAVNVSSQVDEKAWTENLSTKVNAAIEQIVHSAYGQLFQTRTAASTMVKGASVDLTITDDQDDSFALNLAGTLGEESDLFDTDLDLSWLDADADADGDQTDSEYPFGEI